MVLEHTSDMLARANSTVTAILPSAVVVPSGGPLRHGVADQIPDRDRP